MMGTHLTAWKTVGLLAVMLAALFTGAVGASAQDADDETAFKEGLAAYKHSDYATALKKWRPMAEQGDARAQFNLGLLYDIGQGVPQDYGEAARWYRMAAEKGYTSAQVNLGVLYNNGQGVPQDYGEAASWSRMAAEQGIAMAQFNLGLLYANGQGAPQDYVEAHMWVNLAVSRTSSDHKSYSDMIKTRDNLAALMTRDQLAEAQAKASAWRP